MLTTERLSSKSAVVQPWLSFSHFSLKSLGELGRSTHLGPNLRDSGSVRDGVFKSAVLKTKTRGIVKVAGVG